MEIQNFRAIRSARVENIADMVMIAGPNGCGKSCVFDAIRLVKSVYGGYQANEWQQWFGEFQISLNQNPESFLPLLRDRSRRLRIEMRFQLSEAERAFVEANAADLLGSIIWRTVVPGSDDPWARNRGALASELRAHQPEVERRLQEGLPNLLQEVRRSEHAGVFQLERGRPAQTISNILLEVVFSSYRPHDLGVIDYHGAHRNYNRETVGGINLNLEQSEQQQRAHALYNYANKYTNVKAELAASYVRALIARESGADASASESLTATLQELFETFFPGKRFGGPQPSHSGSLDFPVVLPSGLQHDINDLSSGEKEVLFGYLRLRNTAPRNSVILLDEPELHLNPALVRGLPQFYEKHLGKELGNQVWLVTHSDAFLRESVGQTGFTVLHMIDAEANPEAENQLHAVTAQHELERAILDLVGDMAAYRPGAKLIVFEGADSDFDLSFCARLFPELDKAANLVSAGNKTRVLRLHDLLERASAAGRLPVRFYAIVDSDAEREVTQLRSARQFRWDAYHIENYLLQTSFILRVLTDVGLAQDKTESWVDEQLKLAAANTTRDLVRHHVTERLNAELLAALSLRVSATAEDLPGEFARAVAASVVRVRTTAEEKAHESQIRDWADEYEATLTSALNDGTWRQVYRGRDVIRRFVNLHGGGMRYEHFRELIISRMRDDAFRPAGMARVIDAILGDRN